MWFRRIFNASPTTIAFGRRKLASAHGPEGDELALSPGALRQLNRLQLVTSPSVSGEGTGERASHRRRPAMDFREHRMYAPGDDIRFVDWKASARQEHVFIKQGEQQKNLTVYLLLDCSASMGWGSPPKSRTALELAAALGYLSLAHGDRLVLLPASDPVQTALPAAWGPVSGKGQFPRLLSFLRSLRFAGRVDLGPFLAALSRRSRGGGLVLVLSDFLGTHELEQGLQALPQPHWNLALLHLLHPAEVDPPLNGDFELQDIETGQVRRCTVTQEALRMYRQRLGDWQAGLQEACRERRARYAFVQAGASLPGEVIPTLRSAQVVKPR